MTCKCGSQRIAEITAKCADLCEVNIDNKGSDGYVPEDMGIGGGDYIDISMCLDCGLIQGKFPLPATKLERLAVNNCDNCGEFLEEFPNQCLKCLAASELR